MTIKLKLPEIIEYPPIQPVPEGTVRPLWSVMIPTYNCAHYLERTLQSILAQDPGPQVMQIEVIDDCSTKDDPEEVVRRVGKGRIAFFRQPRNMGAVATYTTCIQRAKGQWLHILHGDDMLLPGFYAAYEAQLKRTPSAVLVFGRVITIDENEQWQTLLNFAPAANAEGVIEEAADAIMQRNFMCAPAVVVRRDIYTKVGGFLTILPHAADWEMWVRVAREGQVAYIHQPYFLYRVHAGSDTSKLMKSAQNIEDSVRAVEISLRFLSREKQAEQRALGYRHCSLMANNYRRAMAEQNLYGAALRHALWSFRLDPSWRRCIQLVLSTLKVCTSRFAIYEPTYTP